VIRGSPVSCEAAATCSKGPYLPQPPRALADHQGDFGAEADQLKGAQLARRQRMVVLTSGIDCTLLTESAVAFIAGAVSSELPLGQPQVQPQQRSLAWHRGDRGFEILHGTEPLGRRGDLQTIKPGWAGGLKWGSRPVADPARGPPSPVRALLGGLTPARAGIALHSSTGAKGFSAGGRLRQSWPAPFPAAMAPSNPASDAGQYAARPGTPQGRRRRPRSTRCGSRRRRGRGTAGIPAV